MFSSRRFGLPVTGRPGVPATQRAHPEHKDHQRHEYQRARRHHVCGVAERGRERIGRGIAKNSTASRSSAYCERSDTRPQRSGATSLAPRYISVSITVLATISVSVVSTCGIDEATLYTVVGKEP